MIWLVWRQYRVALIGLLLLVVLFIFLLIENLVFAVWSSYGSSICIYLFLFVGIFLGAPLVAKELEQRTHYFVWTQSFTRKHWLAVKLGLLSGATLLAFGVLMLVTGWGNAPINAMKSPWQMYESLGIVPMGYGLFGLMLGVAIGTFLRQTIPAMQVTFVTLLFVSVALHNEYPYLVPPMSRTFVLDVNSNDIMSYMYSEGLYDRPIVSRNLILFSEFTNQQDNKVIDLTDYCGFVFTASDRKTCIKKAQSQNLHLMVFYQPAERFWLIQSVETGILLVMTGALVLLIYWGIRKRVS